MAKQLNMLPEPKQTAYGPDNPQPQETQAQRRQREQLEQYPDGTPVNKTVEQVLAADQPRTAAPGKKSPRPLDPTLRLAAKLDRLLAEMVPEMRFWAIEWLKAKYERTEAKT